jgi:hypothetical protein
MFFVPWGFHIKNNIIYDGLVWPMRFLNQWRLPILFVISGMGTYYALAKRTGLQFSAERIKRLLLPLVFGMIVVIPPQVYIERIAKDQFSGTYFDFWPSEAFLGVYPVGNLSWHHLWFLPYLLVFSLILSPVFLYLKKQPDCDWLSWVNRKISSPITIYFFTMPLFLTEFLLEPYFPATHALTDDWFTFFWYFFLFLYGFVLMNSRGIFWKMVQANRRKFLINGLIGFLLLVGSQIAYEDSLLVHFTGACIKAFNLWSWILAIFGYAARYLNHHSKWLAYSNEAVYPFYILHQSIMMVFGFYLMELNLGFWPKAAIMVFGTFMGSFVLYEYFIKRISFVRPLFGLKPKNNLVEKPGHQARVVINSRS